MKLAFFEVENWEKEVIKKSFPKQKILFFKHPLGSNNVGKVKDVEIFGVFINSKIKAALLESLPKLKFIATKSTGFDHIDLEACKQRKIKVANVPHYGMNTVAEHTFCLLLALFRQLPLAIDALKAGNVDWRVLRGLDLEGKTLGVVGTGNIGQHVIKIAKGFGMKVIAFDIWKNREVAQKLGFTYATMDALLRKSDVITLHVSYNKKTHHLIDAEAIKKMKKGVYLINTARGPLIDTTSLLKALDSGKVAGAGLDVCEEEAVLRDGKRLYAKNFKGNLMTIAENHLLLNHPKAIMTPHVAFDTREAILRIVNTTIKNIKGFLKGRKVNVIN